MKCHPFLGLELQTVARQLNSYISKSTISLLTLLNPSFHGSSFKILFNFNNLVNSLLSSFLSLFLSHHSMQPEILRGRSFGKNSTTLGKANAISTALPATRDIKTGTKN